MTEEEWEKPAVGKASVFFQRPYGEGNMQRLFQNAHPFPKALHLHWIGQMQLFQKNHLAKTIGKYQKHFHKFAIFSHRLWNTVEATETIKKILEWSIAIIGHWICIPEKYWLRSRGMIKPLNVEFLLIHPCMTLTFRRSFKSHFCSKQTSYQF